jgi:hypothetical protein
MTTSWLQNCLGIRSSPCVFRSYQGHAARTPSMVCLYRPHADDLPTASARTRAYMKPAAVERGAVFNRRRGAPSTLKRGATPYRRYGTPTSRPSASHNDSVCRLRGYRTAWEFDRVRACSEVMEEVRHVLLGCFARGPSRGPFDSHPRSHTRAHEESCS